MNFSSIISYDVKLKIFSDNILIALKNDKPTELGYPSPFNYLCALSALIQRWFLNRGILLRGSITQGKLFIDDSFVWGTALINGYKIEQNIAIYPGIIIDSDLTPLINEYMDTGYADRLDVAIITRDFDEELFLDYLNYQKIDFIRELVSTSVIGIKKCIKTTTDERIIQKYNWHINYVSKLNVYCIDNLAG